MRHFGSIAIALVSGLLAAGAAAQDSAPLRREDKTIGQELLLDLLARLGSAPWQAVDKSLATKLATLSSYDLSVYGWQLAAADFRVAIVPSTTSWGSTVAELRAAHQAFLAINAGFFDFDAQSRLSPSGLVIADGRLIAPATDRKKGGSGILYSRGSAIEIDFIDRAGDLRGIQAAVQVGPLVVDPGGKNGIRHNDFNRARRSAVCLLAGGAIVIVLVDGGLSLYELGVILATQEPDGGFGCERALNLDGGPSTQVSFAAAGRSLEITGRWKVANALLILPR